MLITLIILVSVVIVFQPPMECYYCGSRDVTPKHFKRSICAKCANK